MNLRPRIAASAAHRGGSSASKALPGSSRPDPPNKHSDPRPPQGSHSKLPFPSNCSSTKQPNSRSSKTTAPSVHPPRPGLNNGILQLKESHQNLTTHHIPTVVRKFSVPRTSTDPHKVRFGNNDVNAIAARNPISQPKGVVQNLASHPKSAAARKLSKPISKVLQRSPPLKNHPIPLRMTDKEKLKKLTTSTMDRLPRRNQQKPSDKSVCKMGNLQSEPRASLPTTPKKSIEVGKKLTDAATPPVKVCVSPEIRQAALAAPRPFCHADGHLLAGVPDGRKCRPRGLLITGESVMEVEGAPPLGIAVIKWTETASKLTSTSTAYSSARRGLRHDDYGKVKYQDSSHNSHPKMEPCDEVDEMVMSLDSLSDSYSSVGREPCDDDMVTYQDSQDKDWVSPYIDSEITSPSVTSSHSPFSEILQQGAAARAGYPFGYIAEDSIVKSPEDTLFMNFLTEPNSPCGLPKNIDSSTSTGSFSIPHTWTDGHPGGTSLMSVRRALWRDHSGTVNCTYSPRNFGPNGTQWSDEDDIVNYRDSPSSSHSTRRAEWSNGDDAVNYPDSPSISCSTGRIHWSDEDDIVNYLDSPKDKIWGFWYTQSETHGTPSSDNNVCSPAMIQRDLPEWNGVRGCSLQSELCWDSSPVKTNLGSEYWLPGWGITQ